MLIPILLIFVFITLWWLSKLYIYYVKLRQYDGPTPLPIIGNSHYFSNGSGVNCSFGLDVDPHRYTLIRTSENFSTVINNLYYYQKKFGSAYKMMLGHNCKLVITDHKAAEILLNSTEILDKSYEYSFFIPWLGTGLITSKANKWKVHRKLITPTFHFKILDQFIDVFNNQHNTFVKCLEKHLDGNPFDMFPIMSAAALDIICETAMGAKVNAQIDNNSKYCNSIKEISHIVAKRMFTPLFFNDTIYKFTDSYKEQQKVLSFLHDCTNSIILQRHEKIKNSAKTVESHPALIDNNDVGEKKKIAFMDLLLQCNIQGQPLSNDDIRNEVDTFMFAGHDTVTSAGSFALYLLAHNQDVQEKVVEELRTIFADDKSRPATHEDFNNMKYMEMVLKESMRIYPPATFIARGLNQDTKFGDKVLPKGTSMMLYIHGLHRQPDMFPDPEKFDPERFSLENTLKRPIYAYLPFSAGSRNCIGQRFAYLVMKSTLSSFLRNYQVLPVENYTPELIFDLILHTTNGMMLKIKKRQF